MGPLMEVKNSRGLVLYRDAKLAQIGFEESGEVVAVHGGVYQASSSRAGKDGVGKQCCRLPRVLTH
jgi:dUTP pyrophosphatase